MKKIISLAIYLILFFHSLLQAQVTTANWKAHFAYLDFVDIAVSDDNIYIAASNSVFVHNVASNSNTEFTSIDGLSGEDISAIHYSADQSAIVIGYENGLVEIVNEITGSVTTLVDISSQSTFSESNLKINHFFQDGDILYIATGFGVVQYNLSSGFFGDTFLISDSSSVVSNVLAVGLIGDRILASIAGRGVYAADINDPNLISETGWTNIQPDVFVDIQSFSEGLIAHNETSDVYSFDNSVFSVVYTNSVSIFDFQTNTPNELTLTYATGSLVLNTNFEEQLNVSHLGVADLNISTSIYFDNEIYFSNSGIGFYKTIDLNFENIEKISPDGPILNNAFSLDAHDGDLWATYGDVNVVFSINQNNVITKTGLSRLRGDEWGNFPYEDLQGAADISGVNINKENKDQVFFSSFYGGLLEYNDGVFNIYNSENSNIEDDYFSKFDTSSEELARDKVFKSTFDSNGNLWILNNRSASPIKQFSKTGDGKAIDFKSIVDITIPGSRIISLNHWDIVVDDQQNIFAGNYNRGLIAYQASTNSIVSLSDADINNIPSTTVRTLAIDLNNELWVGTNDGVRKFSNPDLIFQNGVNAVAESIIFLDEGIAQELLFEQLITDIEVDVSNNKWISTTDGGVFYVSPDGQETIYNFTKENSPLPSNSINDMAIDNSTGAVFFATTKGLMEFNSNVTIAEENLSVIKVFPNPVRPEYENPIVTIQGLTAGANVKITDIEGNLVYETQNETFELGGSGSVLWDTKSFSGKKVSSGVYLILITDEEGVETSIEKLLIVR